MRFSLVMLGFVLTAFSTPVFAQALETAAKQAMIVDYDTGTVLFEKNADDRMPTSSMSKTMTLYMVFDALKNEKIKLDDTFLVSEEAWRKGGSKMFVELHARVSVEDLIRGVAIQSGNDATIVLAEGLSGSESAFAVAMNAKAKELGMDSSHFANASGWPDPQHYSTARDLVTLGIASVRDFPDYYHYYAEKEYEYHKIVQHNRNPLLYRNSGADGIKTGHTEDAGYGLIGSGKGADGRRVILVVNGLESDSARAQESSRLLEWGLQGFSNKTLFKAGEKIVDAAVVYGAASAVPMVVERDMIMTVPKISSEKMSAEIVYKQPLIAPVAKGDTIGTLFIKSASGSVALKAPVKAGSDVPEQGLFAKTLSKAKQYFARGS